VLELLRDAGFPVTEVLGAGMEGTVAGLDAERVVKLWDSRGPADLERLRTFYDAVHGAGLSLAVPRILDVVAVRDRWATVQVRLQGVPVWTDQDVSPSRDDRHARAMLEVLSALVAVRATDAMAVLPMAVGAPPFDPAVRFGHSLANLVDQRAAAHVETFAVHLPDMDARAVALAHALRALPTTDPGLVHGDLGPGNILAVAGRPSSLLDFGYLSTVGDPAFDAAVAATLFDMFGPSAADAEAWLDRLVAERFGYDRERILVYRAAYAIVTASCLVSASDGRHFRWCVDILRRPDISDALEL